MSAVRVILVGAGHAHAQVLKAWARAPRMNLELLVVSPQALAPYSGMVPGWLGGVYRFEEIVIDFPRLCKAAGARWIQAELVSLDPDGQCLMLDDGSELGYDWLSLNVGSTLDPPAGAFRARILPLRPLASLRDRYEVLLSQWRSDPDDQPLRLVAVGGGAAGFESLLAVVGRLRRERPAACVRATLISSSRELLPGYPGAARRAARRALERAQVEVRLDTFWTDADGERHDWVLWATGAQPHAWQRRPETRGRLAASPEGFIRIDSELRSASHPTVFAAGDCAQWDPALPKAGVYAVRMGPVLLHNLRAAVEGRPLHSYRPQRAFLSLLDTADGRAIAARGPLALSGRWAWRLKNHIDRGFVARHR